MLKIAKLLRRIRNITGYIAKINEVGPINTYIVGPPDSNDLSIMGTFEKFICPVCGLKDLNCTNKIPVVKIFKITPKEGEEDAIVGEIIRLLTIWITYNKEVTNETS